MLNPIDIMVNTLSRIDLPTLQTWVKLKATTKDLEPKSRRQVMKKTIKNIGLDVHKNSISIGIADMVRNGAGISVEFLKRSRIIYDPLCRHFSGDNPEFSKVHTAPFRKPCLLKVKVNL